MVGNAHADGLLARQAPRHFAARAQDEGVAAGRNALDQLELRVVHDRVLGHLREVAAHQREVVTLVDGADATQALEPPGVAAVAAKRVAGIGRIGDHPAAAHDVRRLANQALLRMRGMNREELRHQAARNSSTRRATAAGWSWCSMWPASGTLTCFTFGKAAQRSAICAALRCSRFGVSDSAPCTHNTGARTSSQQARTSS